MKKKNKIKVKYLCISGLAVLGLVLFIIFLLSYKPSDFGGIKVAASNEVSAYLTHQLLPEIYNKSQYDEPFDLEVLAEGINDIIGKSEWPREKDGVLFLTPKVSFVPGTIVLEGIVSIKDIPFAVTMYIEPRLDDGLLNLSISSIRVGAVRITTIAKLFANDWYKDWDSDSENADKKITRQFLGALIEGKGFDPVFNVRKGKVCIEKIDIRYGKLTLGLRPIVGK